MGSFFKSKPAKSSSESTPWSEAIPALKTILGDASKLYEESGGINQDFVKKSVANLTPEMQSTVSNLLSNPDMVKNLNSISEAAGGGTQGISTAAGLLTDMSSKGLISDQINQMSSSLYDSDLVKSQVNQLGQDVREQLGANIQDLNQASTSTGNMGSSRAGVAEGVAKGKAAEAIASGSADIQNAARQSAQNTALSTLQGNQVSQLSAANQLGGLGLGAGNLQSGLTSGYNQATQNQLTGAGILQNQAQNVADTDWYNQVGQQQQGWTNLGNLAGVATGIGGMGGTSTGTQKAGGQSTFNQLLGGASTVAGIGGMFGFSDASLKKNVKKIGEDEQGNSRYEWEWNKSANKKGLKGKSSGVLAQEVIKDKPQAVGKDAKTGKMKVNYGILGGR